MGDVLTDTPAHIHKISIDPSVTTVNVAVTQDAKDAHTADFTVNLKDPLSCKEAPASGTALGFQPAATELDGTYDTYTHTAAAGTTAASAQIVLTEDSSSKPKREPRCITPSSLHPRITRNNRDDSVAGLDRRSQSAQKECFWELKGQSASAAALFVCICSADDRDWVAHARSSSKGLLHAVATPPT